jgi:iron-sulfur cluster repair protein YtfE (RIC family)
MERLRRRRTAMPTPNEWLVAHVAGDHERLLKRLRSLDHSLENILYQGEVCGEQRGLGGLRLRCRELQESLSGHIPEEEEMFARLEARDDLRPLLGRLREEHRAMTRVLGETLASLDALLAGEWSPDHLFTLQEKVRALSAALQDHIATENRLVLPRLAAA